MTYVITEPCIGTKDASCVDVCPVDCIYTTDDAPQYYIDPDTCIDCAACEAVCPVTAIFFEDDVPGEWKQYTAINRAFFKDVPAAERTFRPRTERTP
jgi:NAD-dependent dihydropyrimidine dehydrogenase PreA subunit